MPAFKQIDPVRMQSSKGTIMLTRRTAMLGAAVAALILAAPAMAQDLNLPRQHVDLVAPPFVQAHEQATKEGPKIMEFKLVIEEKKMVVDDQGTTIQAMTYNGSMPGPLMVVHEGDYVELTLVNPDTNTMPHNIMNGAVMVLPRDGLKDGAGKPLHYDRVYYIGEQDLYVPRDHKGRFKTYESLGDSYSDTMEAMRTLIPTHVVFNGKVGALTGKDALTSKVGETVLIVHSEANRDTRPHLIGGHGDYVWESGKFSNPPETGLETWFIRGGSAGAALYTFRQPGIYAYVSHNLIEAAEFGATAHFKVEGQWNDDLMTQVKAPEPIPHKVQGRLDSPVTAAH
jgi:nitrite reductase (NO-forming)